MTNFVMPTLESQPRGPKPKPVNIIDKDGKVYHVKSLKRFAELTNIQVKSFYPLINGRAKTLYGLSIYEGDINDVEHFVVDRDTGK